MQDPVFRGMWDNWCNNFKGLARSNYAKMQMELSNLKGYESRVARDSGHLPGSVGRAYAVWSKSLEKFGPAYKKELESRLSALQRYTITRGDSIVDRVDVKEIPIGRVLEIYNKEVNKSGFIKSPYHEEKTPSCKIYLDTNSFYDFSSGKGGSVIDLVMALEGCSVIDAIALMQGM